MRGFDGDQVQVDMEANHQEQEEDEAQIEDAHGGQSPPQRLTRSMFKAVPSRIRALTKSRPKSTSGVKVNVRRRLGEGIAQLRRRPNRASPRSNLTKARQSQCSSPIPMGRKDHGGSDAVGRPQIPTI